MSLISFSLAMIFIIRLHEVFQNFHWQPWFYKVRARSQGLHGTFCEKEMKYVSERTLALLKKQYGFQHILLDTERIFTSKNDVLSDIFIALLQSFLQVLKAKKFIAKSSRVIQSCDTIRIASKYETKQTRHGRNIKRC